MKPFYQELNEWIELLDQNNIPEIVIVLKKCRGGITTLNRQIEAQAQQIDALLQKVKELEQKDS
jgi:hypothetical protein